MDDKILTSDGNSFNLKLMTHLYIDCIHMMFILQICTEKKMGQFVSLAESTGLTLRILLTVDFSGSKS